MSQEAINDVTLVYLVFPLLCCSIIHRIEAKRLVSVALNQALSAKEKVNMLKIGIQFYTQQMEDAKAVALGQQALQVSTLLFS